MAIPKALKAGMSVWVRNSKRAKVAVVEVEGSEWGEWWKMRLE